MANTNEARNIIISDVILFWPKLGKPIENQFSGDEQWEVQIRVPEERKAELEALGKIREHDDGTVSFNTRKKSIKADGSPALPVAVVDKAKNPVDPKSIGNGTKANVMLMLRDFVITNPKNGKVTKEGTSVMLNKIQVTELVKYEAKANGNFTDFDYDEDAPKTSKPMAEDADF